MKKLVILALSLILLVSCGAKQPLPSETTPEPATSGGIVWQTDATAPPETEVRLNTYIVEYDDGTRVTWTGEREPLPGFEEVQALYPDKTVLVWAFEGYPNEIMRVKEINEYLSALGKDYVVCLLPVAGIFNSNNTYPENLDKLIASGEQVDIIYSSNMNSGEAGMYPYHRDVFAGRLEPLDGYLSDTDIGRRLYELMPENHWEALRVNGSIYGVDGGVKTIAPNYGYYFNEELVNKYGYDIYKPFSEQIDILKSIEENENVDTIACHTNFVAVRWWSDSPHITSAVCFDMASGKAKSILEDEEYLTNLRELFDANREGVVDKLSAQKRQSFFAYRDVIELPYDTDQPVSVPYGMKNQDIVKAIPVFKDTILSYCPAATGISAYSTHKDMAFDLLALTQTDAALNNLLVYGVADEDYTIENGCAKTIINALNIKRFANRLICLPCIIEGDSEDTPRLLRSALENGKRVSGFVFDGSECIAESWATQDILDELNDMILLSESQYNSFDELISDYQKKLKSAGIDKIIDEADRQYALWRDEK